jgi:hypothetical protein
MFAKQKVDKTGARLNSAVTCLSPSDFYSWNSLKDSLYNNKKHGRKYKEQLNIILRNFIHGTV